MDMFPVVQCDFHEEGVVAGRDDKLYVTKVMAIDYNKYPYLCLYEDEM